MTTDVHTLSGAYALDALHHEEASDFREHLRGCPACCDEVRELREAASLMGSAEAMTPPPTLRARVLAAAERTPQQPPVVTLAMRRARRSRRWLAGVAAAVVLVGGGVVGVNALTGDDAPGLGPGPTQVFSASDVKVVSVDTTNGGTLRVAMSKTQGDMAVDTRGLPKIGEDRSYQLWSIQDGVAKSVTVFAPDDTGASMPLPADGTQVAITVEPHGGSDQPTTTPIATVDPASV